MDGTTTDPVVTPRGFSVGSVDELHEAARRLDELGVEHGEVTPLPAFGLVVLSVQDPDDVNLELAAPHPDGRA